MGFGRLAPLEVSQPSPVCDGSPSARGESALAGHDPSPRALVGHDHVANDRGPHSKEDDRPMQFGGELHQQRR
jgi:hypothetical protein